MLIIHAADLHLGKTLHERDISTDQEAMLESLLELLAQHRPAALLLAGDLYDRSIPPPEAVRLFDSFLSRAVTADPSLVVVAIPGNHDSAARLSFGNQIMSRAGLHIRTSAELCTKPVLVERGGEKAAIWPLPFLGAGAFDPGDGDGTGDGSGAEGAGAAGSQSELDFGSEAPEREPGLRGQAELFAEAMRRILPRLDRGAKNILLAHCFAAGGSSSESERSFVGNAEQVDAAAFAAFDYVALGHLHRFQAVGSAARYSGSPLAYSFAEGGEAKGFVLVDLKAEGGFDARLLPLEPLHRMRRLEGPFSVLSARGAYPECREDFIEARLSDPEPVLNPADPLRANFPNLLSVRQAAFELSPPGSGGEGGGALPPTESGGPNSVLADFSRFHAEMKGFAPDEETARLFAELVKEASLETL
jgi:DNA repair protein SbcD/Mre11